MNAETSLRQPSWFDQLISRVDGGLRELFPTTAQRPYPAELVQNPRELTTKESALSAGLLRVDHCGEVCAQALYQGQAWTTPTEEAKVQLRQAAQEEQDHLMWCARRLEELEARPSVFSPIWYTISFGLGATMGLLGQRISLGFVHATEHGVERHLADHLQRLPEADHRSRSILMVMQEEEVEHGQHALMEGGVEFPSWVLAVMRGLSTPMTTLSFWL